VNVVNRLANAFGFVLRDGQLHSGTRSLHRFGYRFPGFLLSGGDGGDSGDVIENPRHAVFDAPAATSPELRSAAATGDSLTEPWKSYAATVRDLSFRVTDADIERLATEYSEAEIFEVTVAVAVGAALRSHDAGLCAVRGSSAD